MNDPEQKLGRQFEAVLIAGPTASGKSALAIGLAQRIGGTIVNADSMQVYRDLRILTARPSREDETLAPHRLYGTIDGAENFSVGRYVTAASAEIGAIQGEGGVPILVGGTGLYFKALTQGLSDIPPVPDAVRERVRTEAEGRATPLLYADLAARDPATSAGLRPTDRQRILRALEVMEATGRPLVFWQGRKRPAPLAAERCLKLFLSPERELLVRRIDARFETMMAEGALEEVKALAARGLDPALPVMRAHGVPGLIAYLRGEVSLEDAVARGKLDTRHYARRQFTWFRHQMPGWIWAGPDEAEGVLSATWREGAP